MQRPFLDALLACLLLVLTAGCTPAVPRASGPLVDLDASNLPEGPVETWTNAGSLGGVFAGGFSGGAVAETVGGRAAVSFDGKSQHLASTFAAPMGITGNHAYTVAVWAFNPQVAGEECMVQWARRGTTSRGAQLNYGTSKDFGAVTHWGSDDMGYDGGVPAAGQWHHIAVTYEGGEGGTETLYVDGQPSATEKKTLDLWPGCPIRLANADGEKIFSGSIAAVQVYDGALAADEVAHLAGKKGRVPGAKPLVDLDAEGLPRGRLTRWANRGTLGGAFGLESSRPTAAEVAGRTAVAFERGKWLKSDFAAPAGITGDRPFTVEVWAYRPEPPRGRGTVLSWSGLPGPGEIQFGFGDVPTGNAFSAGRAALSYGRVPAAGQWHHIAWTYAGGEGALTVYVDGEIGRRKPVSLNTRPGGPLFLGGVWETPRATGVAPFSGRLARLRVYDRALAQAEIRNSMGLYTAFNPTPHDREQLERLRVTLGWTAGTEAARSFDVYLGADRGAVGKAERFMPAGTGAAGSVYKGTQAAAETRYGPIDLALGKTYYWRVDELDESGGVKWRGDVWTFTADTGKAASPGPRDRVAGVRAAAENLAWTPGRYATEQSVHFGTSREEVEKSTAPAVAGLGGRVGTCRVPGLPLACGTTYYWRVDALNGDLPPIRGDVWAFRTADKPASDDVTFFVTSDTHYGATETIAEANRATIDSMNFLPGTPYPAALGGGLIRTPRGVVLCGDLTNDGKAEQWDEFVKDYGAKGEGKIVYPVYEIWGNHDGDARSAVREGVRGRTPGRPGVAAISPNGLHYSWDWDRLHLVSVNVYPGTIDGPDSKFRNRPQNSLEFLADDLARNVGRSGRPVVIFQHFGWDDFSTGWQWWTERERNTFYEAIRDYNVVGIFHGHSHGVSAITWRGIDVFNVGSGQRDPKPGDCFVVRITPDRMTVAQRVADRWNLTFTKPVTWGSLPMGRPAAGVLQELR